MRFYREEYTESAEPLGNPDCGWYHIYPYVFKEMSGQVFPPVDFQALAWDLRENREERLALIQFHIGFFRAGELTDGVLQHMERILMCFRAAGKQIILRVVYDLEGKGLLREPSSEGLIHRHMEQIGPLIRACESDLLTLQGIFVGSWGEMHDSSFLSEASIARLILSLHHAAGKSCFLAVRTPAQWRSVAARLAGEPGLMERLTLFNDGLFGSDTDLGTYGAQCGKRPDEAGRWGRKEEVEWQSRTMGGRPVGGEAVASAEPVSYQRAAEEMTKLHFCYLNSTYHKKQLDFWRQETVDIPGCWKGLSGYDYIGRHLGPRFMVQDVKQVGWTLRIVLQNRGFSGVCRETDCILITEREGAGREEILPNADVRAWRGGQTVKLSVPLRDLAGPVCLSLALRRREDGQVIRFANQGAAESVRLGWRR